MVLERRSSQTHIAVNSRDTAMVLRLSPGQLVQRTCLLYGRFAAAFPLVNTIPSTMNDDS